MGVVFPQVEIGSDPAVIREYAQAVEALGYSHILAFDHVLGANPDRPRDFKGPYTYRHALRSRSRVTSWRARSPSDRLA